MSLTPGKRKARADDRPAPEAAPLEDRLLNTTAAARFLGYHPTTLRKFRCCGAGPAWIVLSNQHSIRYRLSELQRWAGVENAA